MNTMKSMLVVLGLTAVVLASDKPAAQNAAKPNTEVLPAPREKTAEPTKRKVFEFTRYSDLSRSGIGEENLKEQPIAYNGVTLNIQSLQSTEDFSNTINIFWTLEYSGNRLPFTVSRPTLDRFEGNDDDTQVVFYALGRSGETYRFDIHNIPGNTLRESPRFTRYTSHYLRSGFISTKGKERTLNGSFEIQTDDIKRFLLAKKPEEFEGSRKPTLYIKMEHNPSDRGASYKLDSWTGHVESNLTKVALSNW